MNESAAWIVVCVFVGIFAIAMTVGLSITFYEEGTHSKERKKRNKILSELKNLDRVTVVSKNENFYSRQFIKDFAELSHAEKFVNKDFAKEMKNGLDDWIGIDKKSGTAVGYSTFIGDVLDIFQEKIDRVVVSQKELDSLGVENVSYWSGISVSAESPVISHMTLLKKKIEELREKKRKYFEGISDKRNIDEEIVALFDKEIQQYSDELVKVQKSVNEEAAKIVQEDINSVVEKQNEKDREYNLSVFNEIKSSKSLSIVDN